jgi:predicted nuclease of predicted toxin-antitoxin system
MYMAEIAPRASDTEVMLRAQTEQRLLLTEDKDFEGWSVTTGAVGAPQ